MSEAADFARARRLPPAEAIAYMAGRGLVGETFSAYDLWRSEHERAFTVSRLARADLLEAMQASLAKSVAGDLTRRDWIRSTEQLLQTAGWWGTTEVTDPRSGELLKTRFNHARLQLIFDTNLRQAQAAGQWQRMLHNRRTHPYARYVTMDDGRVRPQHQAWHNTVLPLSDTWWATHRPPNGYRCRCRVIGVTQREYDAGVVLSRPGAALDTNAPLQREAMRKAAPPVDLVDWQNPATGQTLQIPAGIDPGFDYNPGTTGRSQAFDEMVQAKLARLPAVVARAAQADRLRAGPMQPFTGQRPGLMALPDVPVVPLAGSALGQGLSRADLVAAAGVELARLPGLVNVANTDTGWLFANTGSGGDAGAELQAALQAVARHAVVAEQLPGTGAAPIYRLAAALAIDGEVFRVWLLAQAGAASQPHQLLSALLEPGSPITTAISVRATVAELLRGARRQDGSPFNS
jgi:SPP1 gp7 family putative phage head morphogenesis protein